MKTEKRTIINMSLEKIHLLLSHLKRIKDCDKLMNTIASYETNIARYPIKKIQKEIAKMDFFYFYEVIGKGKNHTEKTDENLGKLSKELYENNENEIEFFRVLGLKSELKKLIEELNKGDGM